jgi:heme exporter protein A
MPSHAQAMTVHDPTVPPLLEARGLRFARNDEPIFGPLSFTVEPGEALLVRGDNGVGKTTLLRVLAGLLQIDGGEILIDGRSADGALRNRAMAYLGHLPALKADLSALENLEFLCNLHGSRPDLDPEQAMATVGLAGYEDALAPLWLLDEPYANLDLDGIGLVNRMIQTHLREGGATLVTTHGAYAAPPVRTREVVLGRMPERAA